MRHNPSITECPKCHTRSQTSELRGYNRDSRGVAQPGSAPALGAGGRWFESSRPDQQRLTALALESAALDWGKPVNTIQQFIKERKYLSNVSPATIDWYEYCLKWMPAEVTADSLKCAVIGMRERGLKASGCNSVIRACNAYLKQSGSPVKIPSLKEPQTICPTFATEQVKLIITWKASLRVHRRLRLLLLILIDTGCRIDEVLSLRASNCDLDNLLFTVTGKGRKQRRVPFSFELRRALFKYCVDYKRRGDVLLLVTRNETKLGRRVVLRDAKLLCKRLGFNPPARTLHAFRHTFAVNYLRRGGSVFHLQKMLGHTSLDMTRRYANLMPEDLQAVHQKLSLLGAL